MEKNFKTAANESSELEQKFEAAYTHPLNVANPGDLRCIESLISIAMISSRNKAHTSTEIVRTVGKWKKSLRQREVVSIDGAKNYINAYINIEEKNRAVSCNECKKRSGALMKTTIPISYAIIGAVFFALMCVFASILIIGFASGLILVNPWINIMLLVGCMGITATDVAAMCEWRARVGQKKGGN